jgi:putative membrane protein insertion efficiency factor
MKVVRIIGIVLLLTSSGMSLSAQQVDQMSGLEDLFEVSHAHSEHLEYIRGADNPLEFIFATLFVGYKYLLSSQDLGSCVFYPSCSVYGIESIRKNGILLGMIDTFDRLTRCHPFAGGHYPYDPKKNKLYDPVD